MRKDSFLGTLVAGRFRIQGVLGEGASGLVYLAEHARRGTQHAVKVLHASLEDDEWIVERFRREALAASRLDHPNIVFIEDFGQAPDGQLYLVMPYVPGVSLDEVLKGVEPTVLPYPRVLRILAQVADGLSAAHEQAIVHRDVKPANILLHTDAAGAETVMMLDFGLAKIMLDTELSVLTKKGEVFGTPGYMSPEQAAGEEVDTRTDIYSFGVMAYEMLTGRLPFKAKTLPQLFIAHMKETPRPVDQARSPELCPLPAELSRAVMACLEKNADRRPDRVSEVARVLTRCLEELSERERLRETIDILAPDDARILRQWQTADTEEYPMVGASAAKAPPASPSFGQPDDGRSFRWGLLCEQAREVAEAMLEAAEGAPRLAVHFARIRDLEADLIGAQRGLEVAERERSRVNQDQRDNEARLRHAVVNLSLDRDRLVNAGGDAVQVQDLDYQIAQLEARLEAAYRERSEAECTVVARIEKLKEKLAELRRALTTEDLKLLHLLSRKPPSARAPDSTRAAYDALARRMG